MLPCVARPCRGRAVLPSDLELIDQATLLLGQLCQLGTGVRRLLCTLGHFRRNRSDHGNITVDVLRHGTLLFGRSRDLDVHFRDDGNRLGDRRQRSCGLGRLLHAGLGLRLTGLHDLHHVLRTALQLLDHGLDFLSRLLSLARQITNFIRHYGKAAALLTSPCRLNGCVEGQ